MPRPRDWLTRYDSFSHNAERFWIATGRIVPPSARRAFWRAAYGAAGSATLLAALKLFR